MKKAIIAIFAVGAMLTSCSDNGEKAVTKEAEKVVDKVETKNTQKFTNLKSPSYVKWRASHLGGLQPRYGKIMVEKAIVSVDDGKVTYGLVVLNMGSLTVENFPEGSEQTGKLKGHLQNKDFFDMTKYPTARFKLTSVKEVTGKYNAVITGNLTIKDVTKSITFNALVEVSDEQVSINSEDFSVDRTDWGLTYHVEGSKGVPIDYLIANDIGFTISLTLSK